MYVYASELALGNNKLFRLNFSEPDLAKVFFCPLLKLSKLFHDSSIIKFIKTFLTTIFMFQCVAHAH